MGWTGVFIAKTFNATSWHELLLYFGIFCTEFRKATKRFQIHPNSTKMHQNMSLGSNGMDWVRSLQKIQTRLCLTNFCTSSACFAQCFESQPNYPKCTQIVQKTPKHNFRMQWDRVRSLQKISMRLRGNELFALVRSILHRVS